MTVDELMNHLSYLHDNGYGDARVDVHDDLGDLYESFAVIYDYSRTHSRTFTIIPKTLY